MYIAPRHIGQGSPDAYRTDPERSALPRILQARLMAISSAWAVASLLEKMLFQPSATGLPSKTSTAPKGFPSPERIWSKEMSTARLRKARSLESMLIRVAQLPLHVLMTQLAQFAGWLVLACW